MKISNLRFEDDTTSIASNVGEMKQFLKQLVDHITFSKEQTKLINKYYENSISEAENLQMGRKQRGNCIQSLIEDVNDSIHEIKHRIQLARKAMSVN